ncbi:MAG: rod shape-determining protein MreC [Patescibacteria group bacterium]|jgi:rod shape-determining protein MreC
MKLIDPKKYKFFLAVFLLLVFLNIVGFSSLGQRMLAKIVHPISFLGQKLSKNLNNKTKSKSKLLEEITILEKKLELEEVDLAKLYSLEEENKKLREYLNFFDDSSFDYVLANIVWQDNLLNFSNYNQNLVINKGEQAGLRSGLAVVNESGVIVGKVVEVNEKNSRICLINNNFCKMAVSINNSSGSVGLAEGNLGLSIKLNFISQGEVVSVGDRIITSGLERDVPRGLALGRVNYVNQEINDIWQNISAEPLFNINNLNIVAVIIPN